MYDGNHKINLHCLQKCNVHKSKVLSCSYMLRTIELLYIDVFLCIKARCSHIHCMYVGNIIAAVCSKVYSMKEHYTCSYFMLKKVF